MDSQSCAGQQIPKFGMEISDTASQKSFKTQLSAGKVMLTGLILEHCQQRGTTVNSVRYIEMLHDKHYASVSELM
jgi:hypothetical protein